MTRREYVRELVIIIDIISKRFPRIEEIREIKRKRYQHNLKLLDEVLNSLWNSL